MANQDLYRQREKAERIRGEYNKAAAAIRANNDLSDEGQRRQLAEAWVKTKKELDQLAATERAELATRRADLEQRLFGAKSLSGWTDTGGLAISARDASDRAAQLTSPEEAANLLTRAEQDGDELLARAVARQCMTASDAAMTSAIAREWEQVAGTFIDARPSLMSTVQELAEIEVLSAPQVFSPFSIPQPTGVQPSDINSAGRADAQTAATA